MRASVQATPSPRVTCLRCERNPERAITLTSRRRDRGLTARLRPGSVGVNGRTTQAGVMILRMRALGGCLRVGATVLVAVLVAAACSSSSHSSSPKPTVTAVTAPPTSVPTPAGLAVAQVSPVARQTIAGFGASGAWWPIDLASFPASVQRSVADLLFTSAGISLSGYRYN